MLILMLMEFATAAPFPMWGVGITGQTNLYPFGYPLALPTTSVEGANPKTNMQTSSYVATVGVKLVGYLNPKLRGAIRPIYSFGSAQSGYSSIAASLEVDQIFSDYNGIQVFAGGGIGTGGFQFDQGESGVLSGRNLYLRGHGGAFMGSGHSAWELALFAELGFVGEERYLYEETSYSNGGFFNKDEAGSLGWGVYYPIIGVECSGYFGQFGATKKRKKKSKTRRRRR
jgi:hypothetical protein